MKEKSKRVRIPILLYHHIGVPPHKGTPSRSNYVAVKNFIRQMHMLKRLGFKGLSLKDAAPYINGEKKGKIAIITFDDGFLSVYRNAMPVLNELGFTATCFFVARQIGGKNDWDPPEARREACMNEAQIKEWAHNGHEIGSHTLDHVHLTKVDANEAGVQITQSRAMLEDIFKIPVISFAYPYGDMNDDIRKQAKEAGYTYALTTQRGRYEVGDNLYDMPRHSVRRNDTLVQFLIKCLLR